MKNVTEEPGLDGLDDLPSPQTEDGAQIQKWILTQDQRQGSDRKTRPKNYAGGVTRKPSVQTSERPKMAPQSTVRSDERPANQNYGLQSFSHQTIRP